PIKPFHAISLVPAEVNRAVFLLSGRLMEFDAALNRVSTIKSAAETRLGSFSDMTETSDGGLLICAANGIARVPGPLRRLNPSSTWQEYLLSTNEPIENLQRPFEGRDGIAITVGFDRANTSV